MRYVLNEMTWVKPSPIEAWKGQDASRWEVVEKSELGDRVVASNLTYDQAEQVMDYMNDVAPIIERGCKVAPEGGTA